MLFEEPLEYYQAIASELVETINETWISIEIEAILLEDSIELEVVYFRPDGSEESRVRSIMLADYFYELARVVSNESKGLYKKCNFTLKSNGTFDVNFEY
ncbi:hypothetical protein [Vibrio nigripulchritudo]|uniref:hypothetical protein n=1 Tax=Vibrio nigripulchritudo TaxID=28173 RepID=UPI0003B20814|nr:hypothetical protein [Vibrio nigripulchritudo]CCN72619.1 hypothetical protein VIBNISFn118_630009 [Vibrio nigripulchritudo SFn118]